MSKPKQLIIWIACVAIVGIVIFVAGAFIYDNMSLPGRLTSSINSYITQKDIFTESKLVDYSKDGPINLNGDGSMEGTFRLSGLEIGALSSSNDLMKCPPKEDCKVQKNGSCTSVDIRGGVLNILCVDTENNEAHWSVTWY